MRSMTQGALTAFFTAGLGNNEVSFILVLSQQFLVSISKDIERCNVHKYSMTEFKLKNYDS